MSDSTPIIDANTLFGAWPFRTVDISPQRLVDILRRNGVSKALTVSSTGILYDYRRGNDETLRVAQKASQFFVPAATLDPREYLHCAAEIDQRVEQGFRIFVFYPRYQQWPLDFAPFRDILAKLKELQKPVMVQVDRPGDLTRLADLTSDFASPVIASGVSHTTLGEAVAVLSSNPFHLVETHHLNSPDGVEVLADAVGASRLLFGSHAPLRYQSSALMTVRASALSESDRAAVLGGNLIDLLKD